MSASEKNLSYYAQLKHPKWQRKRLEVLEAAGFSCVRCSDADSTLHVHHKRYVKGRMAWEYANAELAALCEACHGYEHEEEESRKHLLSLLGYAGPLTASEFFAYGAGALFHHVRDDLELYSLVDAYRDGCPLQYWAGLFAHRFSSLLLSSCESPKTSMEAVADMAKPGSHFADQLLALLRAHGLDKLNHEPCGSDDGEPF